MATTTIKSKKPTGLVIARSGNTIIFSWKIGAKDYDNGQQFYWNLNGVRQGKTSANPHGVIKLAGNITYRTFTINIKNKKLTSVAFGIRGNSKTKEKGQDPGWSDWATKAVSFTVPPKPTTSFSLNSEEDPTLGTFTFNIGSENWQNSLNSTFQMFWRYEYQTILVKNHNSTTPPANSKWKAGTSGWAKGSGKTVYYSRSFREDPALFTGKDYSYTRWFRIRSVGPRGSSDWKYAYHVYAFPRMASNTTASLVRKSGAQGYICTAKWTAAESFAHPIESDTVQYMIGTPVTTGTTASNKYTVKWSAPTGSWEDAGIVHDTKNTDAWTFSIDQNLQEDEVIFVRVNTRHDFVTNEGPEVFASGANGGMPKATGILIVANPENHRVQVSATNSSNLTASFIAIYLRRSSQPSRYKCVGILPKDQSQITVQCEDWGEDDISIGLRPMLADYSYNGSVYSISNIKMQAPSIQWDEGRVPGPPNALECSALDSNTIQVLWDWSSWADSNQTELSWSDREDAWQSTNEPSSYIVNNLYGGKWNISNVGVGTWYVRARLLRSTDENVIYGVWSETKTVKLSSAPAIPALTLSDGVVAPDGDVTCYWSYVSTDGTSQMQAEICEVTIDDSEETPVYSYGEPFIKTESAQHISFPVTAQGWLPGETHYLAVRVTSMSGENSQGWSAPQTLKIAEPITCSITSTSFLNDPVSETEYELTNDTEIVSGKTYYTRSGEDEESYIYTQVVNPVAEELDTYYEAITTVYNNYSLDSLPLSITVDGAGAGSKTTVAIIRSESYYMLRPDDSEIDGFENETVYLRTFDGDGNFTLERDEYLVGYLDDGASYRLIVLAKETYDDQGLQYQIAEDSIDFKVHWDHQAIRPTGTCMIDPTYEVAIITPLLPEGETAEEGDVCDIYRLSVDSPQLIYQDAEFGEVYVDPYPTIGDAGGYRLVYRTINGDYTTDDGHIAFFDTHELENNDDHLNVFASIIDYGTGRVVLPYNLSLSNSWEKDFQQTSYLGGHIQGDWNPAVKRSGSLNATGIVTGEYGTDKDRETIEAMRRLAQYAGICHVRTPDGSSYAANVNVQEDREERWITKLAKYSLTITRVDSERLDGMPYNEWLDTLEEEEVGE